MGVVGLGGGAGRGGCVTLVWVLPGHRGGRRAEQGGRRRRTADSLLPFPCSFHSFHRLSLASTCPFREAVIKSSFLNIPHFNISQCDRSVQTCSSSSSGRQQSSACPRSACGAPYLFCAPDRGKEKL